MSQKMRQVSKEPADPHEDERVRHRRPHFNSEYSQNVQTGV